MDEDKPMVDRVDPLKYNEPPEPLQPPIISQPSDPLQPSESSEPFVPAASAPHKCPNCGATLVDDAWFCEECGFVVSPISKATGLHESETQPEAKHIGQIDQTITPGGAFQESPGSEHVGGDLGNRLSAREAYVPEPTYSGPSPFAVIGGIAVAALLVFALGKTGVVRLSALEALPSVSATAGSAASKDGGTDDNSGGDSEGTSDDSGAGTAGDSKSDDGGKAGAGDSGTGGAAADGSEDDSGGDSSAVGDQVETDQGVTYTLVHETVTWSEAEQYCEEHGGQLAQPKTKEEWRALRDLCDEADFYVIYLGAQRQADGSFAWLDGTPIDIKTWGPGEPNNAGGEENYLAYLRYTGGGAMYDVPDNAAAYYPAGYVGFVMQTVQK